MVDCDTRGQDHGCSGGFPYDAMTYIHNAPGQMLRSEYPYTGQQGSCQFDPSKAVASVKGYVNAGTGNENAMAAYLVATGPISVCCDASLWSYYRGGVFPGASCGTNIDHAIVAVGFNLYQQYWIIRNSWGADWGYAGYIYLQFGVDACAVSQVASSAVVEKNFR